MIATSVSIRALIDVNAIHAIAIEFMTWPATTYEGPYSVGANLSAGVLVKVTFINV